MSNIYKLKIHHIGIVIRNIDQYLENSFLSLTKKIYDPIQDSNLALVETYNDFFIELIEPISKSSTTFNFLQAGGGYHHLCYLIDDENKLKEITSKYRIKIFWGPKPAVLFDNRNVAFGMNRNNEIIEFLLR